MGVTYILAAVMAGLVAEVPAHNGVARPSAAAADVVAMVQQQGQGNRPPQADQQGPGNRPPQAGQPGQGNRPPQAGQQRPGNRPPQAGQQRPGNHPPQAGQQGQGNRPQAGPPGRPGQMGAPGRGRPPGATTRGGVIPEAELNEQVRSLPPGLQRLAGSRRGHERMMAGAAALGSVRGMDPDAVDVQVEGNVVFIRNERGDVLAQLDEQRARDLGHWDLRRLGDRPATAGSPAFCRSGRGHPVFGREWCLESGFGLGSRRDRMWSRTEPGDIIFHRPLSNDRLPRDVLLDVVGDVVFNRLALHAVSMGYSEPLTGSWAAQDGGPKILYIRSGDVVLAELVDRDRNDRVDVLYVLQAL
jgi:hypothetical protein